METEDWVGKWIAGFSGIAAGNGHNALVYLMKIRYAFKSQMNLWFADEISDETRQAKSARINKFGDIYQPKNQIGDEFAFRLKEIPVEFASGSYIPYIYQRKFFELQQVKHHRLYAMIGV